MPYKDKKKHREYCEEYRIENKKKYKEYQRKFVNSNPLKHKEWRIQWNKKNTKKIKANKLKYKFKITIEEYKLLQEKQNNKCAICGKNQMENKKALAVDHNHKNGEIRGLLCHNCNIGIGMLKDNTEVLLKAIIYLKK